MMRPTIYETSKSNLIFRCGQNPTPDEDARNAIITIINEHAAYDCEYSQTKPITELLYDMCMDVYSIGYQHGKRAERQRKHKL